MLVQFQPLVYARLAQSVERKPFKLVVVGSSPTSGVLDLIAQLVRASDC